MTLKNQKLTTAEYLFNGETSLIVLSLLYCLFIANNLYRSNVNRVHSYYVFPNVELCGFYSYRAIKFMFRPTFRLK